MLFHGAKMLTVFFAGLLCLAQASRAQDLDPLPIEVHAQSLEALALLGPAAGQEQIPPPLPKLPPPSLADTRPLQLPSAPPRRPVNPRVVKVVIDSRTGLVARQVQVTLVDGRILRGMARPKSDATFELRSKDAKGPQILRYEDVLAAKMLPPGASDRAVEGLEITGLAVLAIAAAPFFFVWGLSCGFQCS